MADQLNFSPSPSIGVLAFFRWQSRSYSLMNKRFPKRSNPDSPFNNFTQILGVSAFDEPGISFRLPDHGYSEDLRGW